MTDENKPVEGWRTSAKEARRYKPMGADRYAAILEMEKNYTKLEAKYKKLEDKYNKAQDAYALEKQNKKNKQPVSMPNVRFVVATDKILEIINSYAVGQPVKLIPDIMTLTRIADMAELHATEAEIAGQLGVCNTTWIQFKKDHPEVQEIMEASRANGKVSLRRTQFRQAENNVQMSIFLGKNYLGQSDKITQDVNVSSNVLKSLMDLSEEDYIEAEFTEVKNIDNQVSRDNKEDDL